MLSIPFFSLDGDTIPYPHPTARHAFDNNTANTSPSLLAALTLAENHLRTSRRGLGLGNATSINTAAIFAAQQRHTIQVIATATSTVSITAAICALYWFCMLRRNFRRDLVLLLVVGDFWKNLWYLVYATHTFVHGPVSNGSGFCLASGYLLQMGIMMCDVAIFFMSLHMYLQIFPPSHSFLGHDGLYRIRNYVVAAWIIVPNISSSLAFINSSGSAYQAAGAFCTLPIRPFWYRLALSWVPRYLNWIFVMGVAIRIYSHVGKEFQVFGHEQDRSSSFSMPGESSILRAQAETQASKRRKSMLPSNIDVEKQASDKSVAPDDVTLSQRNRPSGHSPSGSTAEFTQSVPHDASSRRPSASGWSGAFNFSMEPPTGSRPANSSPGSRRGSQQIAAGVAAEDFAPPSNYDPSRHRGSIATLGSVRSSRAPSFDGGPVLAPIREDKRASASTGSSTPYSVAAQLSNNRRRAIQRQLRLLFIYPVIYMILWMIPFVYHCMSYSDYYAQHPVFVLGALNTFCQCFLGLADVAIFSWREKPWRHIPGSDGTFMGSFCFWRFCWGREWNDAVLRRESRAPSHFSGTVAEKAEEDERSPSQAGLLASLKRWSMSLRGSEPRSSDGSIKPAQPRTVVAHKRQGSGGSDRKQLEVERAHERLAMERAEWEANRKSLQERRTSIISLQHAPGQQNLPETKEWWELQPSVSDDSVPEKDHEGKDDVV